jgi:hypothetical protein
MGRRAQFEKNSRNNESTSHLCGMARIRAQFLAYDSALYGPLLLWTAESCTSQELPRSLLDQAPEDEVASKNVGLKLILGLRQSTLVRDWIY